VYAHLRGDKTGERYEDSFGESLSHLALGYVISAVAGQ
jgi:hypothetical protein